MAFTVNETKLLSAYNRINPSQRLRFFKGKELQAKKVIESLVFLLGTNGTYEGLLDLYIAIAAKILLGFNDGRIYIDVESSSFVREYSYAIHPSIASTLIQCIRRIVNNYSFIDNADSTEVKEYSQSFDLLNENSYSENEKRIQDAMRFPDFGVDPNNPIFAHSADGSYSYLNLLYTSDQIPLTWNRVGSIEIASSRDLIDKYELLLPDGTIYLTVYINMYSRLTSKYCPRGLIGDGLEEVPQVLPTETPVFSEEPEEASEEDEYLAFLKNYAKKPAASNNHPEVKACSENTPPKAAAAAPVSKVSSSPSGETGGEKSSKSNFVVGIAVVVALFALLFAIINANTSSGRSLTATPSPSKDVASEYLQKAEKYFSSGKYYSAYEAVETCKKKTKDTSALARCKEITSAIEKAVKKNEPANGTTLERTFQYQGGCIIKVTAKSGPAQVTVKSKDSPAEFVRFYVRKGQTAEINLTGGTYLISYQIGDLWFDDSTGFGKYCETVNLPNEYTFKTTQTVGWISSDVLELTI